MTNILHTCYWGDFEWLNVLFYIKHSTLYLRLRKQIRHRHYRVQNICFVQPLIGILSRMQFNGNNLHLGNIPGIPEFRLERLHSSRKRSFYLLQEVWNGCFYLESDGIYDECIHTIELGPSPAPPQSGPAPHPPHLSVPYTTRRAICIRVIPQYT